MNALEFYYIYRVTGVLLILIFMFMHFFNSHVEIWEDEEYAPNFNKSWSTTSLMVRIGKKSPVCIDHIFSISRNADALKC